MAASTFIDLTVPIVVHGREIGEFDIGVEISILSHGDAGWYWDPPEPMEWETGEVCFYGPKDADGKWTEHPLPDELRKWADAYLESDEAAEAISTHINDMGDDES